MQLVIASEADNDRILEFFSRASFPGDVEVRFRRMFNFFNHYRKQTNDFVTYLLLNDKNEIEAMATLLFRKAYIHGEEQTVGYATDLRVSGSRRATLHWSQHFLPVIETERQKRNCKYMFSIVARSQRQAYNALIRPRSLKRKLPRYHLFRTLQLVSVHGLWPLQPKPLKGIRVTQGQPEDFADVANYLVKSFAERPLHHLGSSEDFRSALENWQGLSMKDFLLARNSRNEILGCCALWSARQVQRYYALKYSQSGENFRQILFWLSFLFDMHRMPQSGSELLPVFMTFHQVDNPDVHDSLMHAAFKSIRKDEFLIYPHFNGDLKTLPPKAFITIKQRFGLFCLLSPNDPMPEFLRPTLLSPGPVFEPAWI